jgi:hypothetical protein
MSKGPQLLFPKVLQRSIEDCPSLSSIAFDHTPELAVSQILKVG